MVVLVNNASWTSKGFFSEATQWIKYEVVRINLRLPFTKIMFFWASWKPRWLPRHIENIKYHLRNNKLHWTQTMHKWSLEITNLIYNQVILGLVDSLKNCWNYMEYVHLFDYISRIDFSRENLTTLQLYSLSVCVLFIFFFQNKYIFTCDTGLHNQIFLL